MRRLALALLFLVATSALAQTQGAASAFVAANSDSYHYASQPSGWVDLDTSGSVSGWIALDSMSANGYVFRWANAGGEQALVMWDNSTAGGQFEGTYITGGDVFTGVLEDGAWHHFVWSWHTSSSGSACRWVDGTHIGCRTNINDAGGPFTEPSTNAAIGYYNPSTDQYLSGKLAHLQVRNGVFTSNENEWVNRMRFCVDEMSTHHTLVQWVPLWVNGGSAITDRSGEGNAVSVVNAPDATGDGPPTNFCGAGGAQ